MTAPWPNPALPGFHPDPSIVLVDGVYHLVSSSFEYLPGLPVHRSTDLVTWQHVGNVATRVEQLGVEEVPTPGGAWAPTIRFHDGRYYVIVSVFLGGRGCVVFTATDPAGPWDDGVEIPAVDGIDPDLAWDDAGTAYVSYAMFGRGILQVRVDLGTGAALEEPRLLWPGTGLLGTEGPHLYRRDDTWYLVVAEGGTDRGHAVSVARGPSPSGPFESCPDNPVLSARSTAFPVQNLGHADLVDAPDGSTAMVLLGVRPLDAALGFSPLGRETFATRVRWVDGWPRPELPDLSASTAPERWEPELADSAALEDPRWLAVRRPPADVASVVEPGALRIGSDVDVTDLRPAFLGCRQRHHAASFSAVVDATSGRGGVAARHREDHVVAIEAVDDGATTTVTGRAVLSGIEQRWIAEMPSGPVRLELRFEPQPVDLRRALLGGERIHLVVHHADGGTELAALDGRYWSYEVAQSFTGRVLGVYAADGSVSFRQIRYEGRAEAATIDPRMHEME